MTGRQAFLTEMVASREDLGNAIALNSSMVNGARLVGPSLAGLLLAVTSAGVCFLANGVSYVAVLVALLAMRLPPRERPLKRTPLWQGLREGFRYAFGFAPIRALLFLLGLASLTGMSYTVLLPQFTVEVLHGDAHVLGFLTAASGLGALAGALFLAARKSVLGLGRWVVLAAGMMGLALLGFDLAGGLLPALGVLFVVGFAMMVQMAASNTILQTIVDEDKRGRVMSFYTMAFLGMAPLGSLLAGALAARSGLKVAFVVNGVLLLAGAVVFAFHLPRLRSLVRPIYVRLRILPEIAAGIESATTLRMAVKE
jgi:MFS family permease